MGFVIDAFAALLASGRVGRRRAAGPRPHPVPPGLWRDFANGVAFGMAGVLAAAGVWLGWALWQIASDELLGIVGIAILPFALPVVAAAFGLAFRCVWFTRRT